MTPQPLRFGLAGTGHWARIAHAPALASTEGVELAAVWGRNPQAAAELAAGYQADPSALTELAANARSGEVRHDCDVWFGRDVGRVLTEAQRQLDARRA